MHYEHNPGYTFPWDTPSDDIIYLLEPKDITQEWTSCAPMELWSTHHLPGRYWARRNPIETKMPSMMAFDCLEEVRVSIWDTVWC